jgi:acetylornithine deacetylase/succinyl-diaminopimelate desuccinylase-like protein
MEEILRKLVAFQTVTGDQTAAHEAIDYIASFVVARGMHVERFDSNGYESIVATTTPGNKTPKVLLAAHVDVVPAADEMFNLRLENGKYIGRGAIDMKFAIAAYLQIIDDLRDSLADYDLGLMITSDEEDGGKDGAGPLVAEGYLPQVCILPDGGDNWQIQLSSKGFLYLKVAAYGKQAHGSRPWLGDNAILKLMRIITEVQKLFPHIDASTNTLNVGQFSGGEAPNQVADYAEAMLDIRMIANEDRPQILEDITTICDRHDATLNIQASGPACKFDLEHSLIQPFAKLVEDVTGVEVKGSHALGGSDARYFAAQNVPCISLYPTGGGHHSPEEWLDENAFYQFHEVLERYVQQIAKR